MQVQWKVSIRCSKCTYIESDPHEIIGITAGGQHAMTIAVKGAEDHEKGVAEEGFEDIDLTSKDVVIQEKLHKMAKRHML